MGLQNKSRYIDFRSNKDAFDEGKLLMRIQNDGTIGVGTNSPSETLDVNGGFKAKNGTFSGFATVNGMFTAKSKAIFSNRVAIGSTSTSNGRLYIDGSGNSIRKGYSYLAYGAVRVRIKTKFVLVLRLITSPTPFMPLAV
jgi:hypothetical protein